jgi:glycosyltransferase involved in cell wall biosynthesis
MAFNKRQKMSTWFDVSTTIYFPPPAIGIPRVEMSLLEHLTLNDAANLHYCAYHQATDRYYEVAKADVMKFVHRHQHKTTEPIENIAFLTGSNGQLEQDDIFCAGDTFISVGFNWRANLGNLARIYGIRQRLGLRVVMCCHDIIPIKFTHFVPGMESYYAPYIEDMGKNADHILCDSHHTRMDLIVWLESKGVLPPKLSIFPLGCELQVNYSGEWGDKIAPFKNTPYIMLVSTIEKRKNHAIICQAYKILWEQGVTNLPHILFVGGIGHGGAELMTDIQSDQQLHHQVSVVSGLRDDDLSMLYQNCLFSVYPSLYEGFGLPIAESLGYGKLCLTSTSSSMPEVGGIFAEYADPYDANAWARLILRYTQFPEQLVYRERYIAVGYESPTWQAAAAHLLKASVMF